MTRDNPVASAFTGDLDAAPDYCGRRGPSNNQAGFLIAASIHYKDAVHGSAQRYHAGEAYRPSLVQLWLGHLARNPRTDCLPGVTVAPLCKTHRRTVRVLSGDPLVTAREKPPVQLGPAASFLQRSGERKVR